MAAGNATASTGAAGYRREPDILFTRRASNAKLRLLERGRSSAWFGPDGVVVTSGGARGSTIFAAGRAIKADTEDAMDVAFSDDGAMAAFSAIGGGLGLYALPSGRPLPGTPEGSSCAARFASATRVVWHGWQRDASLHELDLTARPPQVRVLGGTRNADSCKASRDGSVFLVHDSYQGVVWRVDGRTGAARELLKGLDAVVLAHDADRVCFTRRDREGIVRCVDGEGRGDETVMSDALPLQIDPSGRRALLMSRNVLFLADFATKTLRGLYGARGKSGGTTALLTGGDVFAAGGASGVDVFDAAAGTQSFIPGSAFYGVTAVAGRPRAMLITTDSDRELYLAEVP